MHPNKTTLTNKDMVCFEYDRLQKADFQHASDFDYLLAQDLPCLQIQFKNSQPILYVRHYLAVIGLPSGRSLEILPKLMPVNSDNTSQAIHLERQKHIKYTRNWVQTMLLDTLSQVNLQTLNVPNLGRQASQSHGHNLAKAHNDSPETWYGWLKNQYITYLNAIGNLSPRHYQTQTLNSPKAMGKLNIKAQIKQNWHRPHYRASEQTQLVDYELLWRFLLTAYQQLQFDSHANDATLTQFHGINPLATSEWQPVYTRLLNDVKTWRRQLPFTKIKDIEQAIAWAWWLMTPKLALTDTLINDCRGVNNNVNSDPNNDFNDDFNNGIKLPKHAFMLNMNQLFEQWVSVCIQRWCDSQLKGSRVLKQPSFDWLKLSEHNIIKALRPDMCIVDANDKISHVIEIKYKQLTTLNAIENSDLYQLATYQNYLQAHHAWLIYPQSWALMRRTKLVGLHGSHQLTDISLIPFEVGRGTALI